MLDGHSANLLIVAARTAGSSSETSGISLFCVDPKLDGVDVIKMSMLDSRNSAEISFSNVKISSDNLLGELNSGFGIIEEVINKAQIGISAEMLGNASQAFQITLSYLKERKQFGVLIGSFQALKHRAAVMPYV